MKNNACALTFAGFESVAAQEISEILGCETHTAKCMVLFSATDEELAQLSYKAQSVKRVCRLYGSFSFTDFADWEKKAATIVSQLDLALYARHPFRGTAVRIGEHPFTSQEIAAEYGGLILKQCKEADVDLDDATLFALAILVDNTCYLTLDVAGFDLSKREYKIYSHPATLNAAFAYCLVRYAGYTGKENFVDPFCGVGTIVLEAALYAAGVSPRFYQKDNFAFDAYFDVDLDAFDEESTVDVKSITLVGYDQQLRHVESARKMSKLADVHKIVSFSRADLEWLDTKRDEKSVDLLVTHPPVVGRAHTEKDMEKLYKEFFYQVDFVLAEKGKIVLLCQKTATLKKMLAHFTITSEEKVFQGNQMFTIVTLARA